MDQQKEIVFTYRQSEQVEAVELRYERELPECMRPSPEPPPADLFDPVEDSAPWRSAIAPPEKRRGGWGTKLFVGMSLLLALVCLGLGIWYVQDYGWALPGSPDSPPSSGGETQRPPSGDRFYFDRDDTGGYSNAKTTITRYPNGGDARLEISSAQGLEALTPSEIYEKVNPSTVTVLGLTGQYASVGTGVIFDARGYILTNYHVVSGCGACTVRVTGDYGAEAQYPALLVGYDEDVDLAVLKIEAWGLKAAEFGASDELAVGDPVYAIGNPLGTDLLGTFTNGIVSAINRDVDVDGVMMTLIQTNAALNSGNSGGPLINQYGQVVGVNTIKMMSEEDTIEGLGFAIPSSLAERWINDLVAFGELQPQPVLGVTVANIPFELPEGGVAVVQVQEITPGGSGDRAGVRPGDYIVAFGGEEITASDQILAVRRNLYVGDEVSIRVYRNGEFLDLTMIMRAE